MLLNTTSAKNTSDCLLPPQLLVPQCYCSTANAQHTTASEDTSNHTNSHEHNKEPASTSLCPPDAPAADLFQKCDATHSHSLTGSNYTCCQKLAQPGKGKVGQSWPVNMGQQSAYRKTLWVSIRI